MVRICIAVVQIDPIRMVRICIRRLESHSNASNTVRRAGIGILILRMPFNWLELAFECFECCSNGWNWHLNASNPVQMVEIGIRMLRIPFYCYNWHSNATNLIRLVQISGSNPIQMVEICIRMLRMVGIGI